MQLQCIFSLATAQKLKLTTKGCGDAVELHTPHSTASSLACLVQSTRKAAYSPLNHELLVVMDSGMNVFSIILEAIHSQLKLQTYNSLSHQKICPTRKTLNRQELLCMLNTCSYVQ